MENRIFGMLGLARRAGKLSPGHDASFEAIQKGKAVACYICTDASDRLREEFQRTTTFGGRAIPLIDIGLSKDDLYAATGIRAAVFTVNEDGFVKKINELLTEENA